MLKKTKFRLIIGLIAPVIFAAALFAIPQKAYSIEEINKKLELKENYSHLLSFDEKIIRYKAGDEKAFNIELLPDIYNSRHELLVRPIKAQDTNLIVWTANKVYNFNIKIKAVNKEYEGFDILEIDLPPGLEAQ